MGSKKRVVTILLLVVLCFVSISGTSSLATSSQVVSSQSSAVALPQKNTTVETPRQETASPWAWLQAVFSFMTGFSAQQDEPAAPGLWPGLLSEDPVTALLPDGLLSAGPEQLAEGQPNTTEEEQMGEIPAEQEQPAEGQPNMTEEEQTAEVPVESEDLLAEGEALVETEQMGDAVLAPEQAPDITPQDPALEQGGGEKPPLVTALFDPMAVMVPFVSRSFTFTVTDDGVTAAPLDGAAITVTAGGSTQSAETNASGQVTLALEGDADIHYTFSKTGYSDVSGVLTGESAGQVGVTMKKLHTVTFAVTDGETPMPGANVLFNGAEKTTDNAGMVAFNVNNGTYAYEVSHRNIADSAAGSVTVDGSSVDIPVVLSGGNRVDFIVKNDAGAAIEGALVTIGGMPPKVETDADGVARAWLVAGQLCEYYVEHPEHQALTGEFMVEAGMGPVELSLSRNRYNVIFVVTDAAGGPLSGATVSIDGRSAVTGAEGRVVVSFLKTGSYDITITRDGYEAYAGRVDIDRNTPEFSMGMTAVAVQPSPPPVQTPEPTPAPTPQPTPAPTKKPTSSGSKAPSPSPSSSPKGSAEVAEAEETPKVSATPSVKPSASPSVSASPSPTPAPSASVETPKLSLGFCLMDADWNPVADRAVELHSEPQRQRTDDGGVVFFLDVEYGKHNLYVMDDSGAVVAQKSFELLAADELNLQPASDGADQLYIGEQSTTVAVDVLLDGNKLSMVKLHEENPGEAAQGELAQQTEEENNNLLVLLAVCIACLIVALAIVFAATKLIKRPGRRRRGAGELN